MELPQHLRAPFVCAYHVGTRKGELRKVQWSQVDFDAGFIHLTARRGGPCPSYGEMEWWLRKQWESRAPGCPWVFRHRGMPVAAQLRGWREACERAGLPGLLFHACGGPLVRNMKRAGVQDKVAMQIRGHKTRSVFDRYNIIDEGDLGGAGEKLEEYFEQR